MLTQTNSAQGAVLGALVGDAAGARLEFLGRLPTEQENAEALAMLGGGVWGVAPGQVTDDGELSIALLRALSAVGKFDLERIANEYRRWSESSPFDIGGTIGSTIGVGEDAKAMQRVAREHIGSKANGSLMRCSPLGVWGWRVPSDELADCARLDSSLSHASPTCMDAVACYVVAIAQLICQSGHRREAADAAKEWAHENACAEVQEWLCLAESDSEVPGYPHQGFVKIAFVHAFRHLHRGTSYLEAIRSVLAIGGDTDTNACIVGGMVGASVGVEGIPLQMRSAVLECDTNLGRRRPEWLWAKQVPELLRNVVERQQD